MTSMTMQRWLRRTAAATVMGASLLWAGSAGAQSVKETCPSRQETAVESKTCPNGAVVKRACCTKTNPPFERGPKTRCKSFPHCPRKSPS
jgi:hypothetical protein